MPSRKLGACAGLLALLSLFAACSERGSTDAASLPADAVSAGWVAVEPIEVSIPIDAPVGDADDAGAEGSRMVIVNLWASYCAPCKKELPLLEAASQIPEIDVIGISRDVDVDYAKEAMERARVTYPNYLDPDASLAIALDGRVPLNAVPSSVLLVDGEVRAVHVGELTSVRDIVVVAGALA